MNVETLRQALGALRANWLRSILTLSIIAFGIMAVVGILTAIDAAIFAVNDNFSSLGANSIEIRREGRDGQSRRGGAVRKRADPISYAEATTFKELFSERAMVSVSVDAASNIAVKHGDLETTPTIPIVGADAEYFAVKSFDVAAGRTLSVQESRRGGSVAVVGHEIVKRLFNGRPERALGKEITAGALRLSIVGVLEEEGQSQNSTDKLVLVPLATARNAYGSSRTSYRIIAALPAVADLAAGKNAAIGAMRVARELGPRDRNDFRLVTSDSLVEDINDVTSKLQAGAIAIGTMTLLGAAIGLMNIMLVSVTERTREIGIVKALGASRANILSQFLTEAVFIAQAGGLVGIVIGIAMGNVVTLLAGGEFLVPWNWIGLSFVVCLLTGLASGLYPAVKAARLDPIESLRYE